jgi:hypothetical protein
MIAKTALTMDKLLSLAKAIELGKTQEATLLHMNELAQVQCEEALVYKVRREETCGSCGRAPFSLREINAQRLVQHVIGARNKITGRRCVDQNWQMDQQKTILVPKVA